jgi:hypothetical protein
VVHPQPAATHHSISAIKSHLKFLMALLPFQFLSTTIFVTSSPPVLECITLLFPCCC